MSDGYEYQEQEDKNRKDTPLVYEFAVAMDLDISGMREGPFALHDSTDNKVVLFGGELSSTKLGSFFDNYAYLPLETGLKLGAVLKPTNRGVVCQIGSVTQEGEDYIDALMRAIITYKRQSQASDQAKLPVKLPTKLPKRGRRAAVKGRDVVQVAS